MSSLLILPGHPLFDLTLGFAPPNWESVAAATGGEMALIARSDSGLLEAVPWAEAEEYLEGGEYDQRLASIGEDDDESLT